MASPPKLSSGHVPFQPGQSVYRNSQSTQSSSNQGTNLSLQEPHHVIRFRVSPSVVPQPPKHSTRKQALLAVKKRLENNHANDLNKSNDGRSQLVSTSQLKSGSQDRGRDATPKEPDGIVCKLRRSLSSKRSHSTTRKIKIISSGGSVCSNSSKKSSKSLGSIKSAGSRVLMKVMSFRRSKSVDGRSVGSTGTRRSWFGRRRRKNKRNGMGENFVFVKQTETPEGLKKRSNRSNENRGFLGLGLLCGSFEPMCQSFFCGSDDHDEDLIGKVIGPDPNTPDTSVEYDPDDPRY